MKAFFKTFTKVVSILLTIIVVLFLATLLPIPGNINTLIVQSGSMEPAIQVGSIVLVKPASEYRVGDVITFEARNENNLSVTHRIAEVHQDGSRTSYVTKGDANEEADSRPIGEDEIIGKVLLDIPYAGYVISFARTPLGFALIIALPLLYIAVDEVRKIAREVRKGKNISINEEHEL